MVGFTKFKEWIKIREGADSKPASPRGMTKIKDKLKKSSGSRSHVGDLSSDYKDHRSSNGEVEPLKCLGK